MKHLELHRLKKRIGATVFGIFYPNENKKLDQKHGIGKQYDLMLVHVPVGKQTAAVSYIRELTDWTVKKATAFIKEGDYPKVITYNFKLRTEVADYLVYIEEEDGIIIKLY